MTVMIIPPATCAACCGASEESTVSSKAVRRCQTELVSHPNAEVKTSPTSAVNWTTMDLPVRAIVATRSFGNSKIIKIANAFRQNIGNEIKRS